MKPDDYQFNYRVFLSLLINSFLYYLNKFIYLLIIFYKFISNNK